MLQGKLKLAASHVHLSGTWIEPTLHPTLDPGCENDVGMGEQQGSGQENAAGWAEMSR